MDWAVIAPIVIALLAPLGAYLVASRRMSGKINTSDANDLWTEARSMRDDYRARLGESADRTRDLEGRVAKLEGQNTELIQENFGLKNKVAALESLVAELRKTISSMEETIATQAKELGKQ